MIAHTMIVRQIGTISGRKSKFFFVKQKLSGIEHPGMKNTHFAIHPDSQGS